MAEPDDSDRDDLTASMFSDDETGATEAGYQVLARKYRPRLFEDLVGQEAMVRTLTNAFETGRIAHAFMLTGVRGVGKTTTARLLARGLNYESADHDGPSVNLTPAGDHCQPIMESRHPDVLELDAASRTGVADMRELLDGVRYAPVEARYKVYIIDEVHMLSTAAFNALLKTLEEPPPHVKFIFATTEIRKVPVTVLSRCQRFDLKRLDVPTLAAHLGRIATREGAYLTDEALQLIARAAEGSVRDGLSILDQSIVQAPEGGGIPVEQVRDMLGLADRGRLLDAFEAVLAGEGARALEEVGEQVRGGADPLVILKDFLEITADMSKAKALGEAFQPAGPKEWGERLSAMAQRQTDAALARYWRMLLTGYEDAQNAPDMVTALDMVVLRLAATAGLPPPEDAARLILQSAGGAGGSAGGEASAGGSSGETAMVPQSLEDILMLLEARREAGLQWEVEGYLRVESVEAGRVRAELADNAPDGLMRRLADFLSAETGMDWRVEPATAPVASLREQMEARRRARFSAAAADPRVAELLSLFEGAEIVDVRDDAPLASEGDENNVVHLNPPLSKTG